jgi:hypothetical protein
MKKSRVLPIPFLIMILAGAVSLFSFVVDRHTRQSADDTDTIQMQTAEQERIADDYFRVLSWLSDVSTPSTTQPIVTKSQPAAAPEVPEEPHQMIPAGRIELCSFPVLQRMVPAHCHLHNFN